MLKGLLKSTLAAILLMMVSLSIMNCKARMPGPEDGQGSTVEPIVKVKKAAIVTEKK